MRLIVVSIPVLIFIAAGVLGIISIAAEDNGVLVLKVKQEEGTAAEGLLDPNHSAWSTAPESALHLNRTPPLYVGDVPDDGKRPAAKLRLLRTAGGMLMARIHWEDPSENRVSQGIRRPDSGSEHIYKEETEHTDSFADAFCAMVPKAREAMESYPSLMMGEAGKPVELYYWRAGDGFQVLGAHGRATTGDDGTGSARGAASREGDGWTLVLELPDVPPGTPIAFAIWDGARGHRNGLKYFSLWYEVE